MPIGTTGVNFSRPSEYSSFYIIQDDASSSYVRISNKMVAIASVPFATSPYLYSCYCSYNGLIYSISGYDGTSDVTNCYVYDPAANSWSSISSIPAGRENAGIVGIDGCLYVFGGTTGNNVTAQSTMYKYTIATDTWTTMSQTMPLANSQFGYCAVGRSIYMIAGYTINLAQSNANTYRYDLDSGIWTQLTAIPNANGLSYIPSVYYSGGIYIAGGKDGSTGNGVSSFYRYDIATDTWNTLASVPIAGFGFNTIVTDNNLYLLGGSNSTGTAISNIYYYNFDIGKWYSNGNLTGTSGNTGYNGVVCNYPVGLGGA